MTRFLVLAPAALGVVGFAGTYLPVHQRSLLRAVAGVGAAVALVTLGSTTALEPWRTIVPSDPIVAMVSAGALVAWIVAGARPDREIVALVGVATSALFLFAGGVWIAPALAFWLCSSLAFAAARRDPAWWGAVAVSDVALVGALVPEAVAADAWRFPAAPGGWEHWAITAAVIVRAGGLVHVGTWRLSGSAAAPIVPLAMTSAFLVAARLGGRPEPWVAAGGLAVAFGLAAWMLLGRKTIVVAGTWLSMVFAALVVAYPEAAVETTWAAAVAAGLVALWPFARGRGAVSRAAALALVPPTPAFAAIALVAATAFGRSAGSGGVERFAWAAVAALLPLVLASAVAVAARAARTPRSDDFEPAPVIATWILLATTLAAGILWRHMPGASPEAFSDISLLGVAAVAGAFGALRARGAAPVATEPAPGIGVRPIPRGPEVALIAVSAVATISAAAGVAWVLVAGLRVGFL